MHGVQIFAVFAAAAITSVQALPYSYRKQAPPGATAAPPSPDDLYYALNPSKNMPVYAAPQQTQSAAGEESTSFPKLTLNANNVQPYRHPAAGFLESGHIKPTGYPLGGYGSGGYAYPSASGYINPAGSGYGKPTGTGYGQATGVPAYSTGSSSSSVAPSSTRAVAAALPTPLKGVNLGNWLILEEWMGDTPMGDDCKDEWTFDGTDGAEAKLKYHWETYITEDDIRQIAAWGLNAVRIPIGYWAYDNSNTPYLKGADEYMERAIGWCRKHGLKVLVDCHGSPGSQNGQMHSGHEGNIAWQEDGNLQQSIEVLKTMAAKYGSMEYADVVFALELVNEPSFGSDSTNSLQKTQQWAQTAYHAVRSAAKNPDLRIVMHDGFQGAAEWQAVGEAINNGASKSDAKFIIDLHLYQNQGEAASQLTQAEHIAQACNYTHTDLATDLPVYVGEFSAGTNICANPDGSTVAGNVCTAAHCQCSSNVPLEYWGQPLKDVTRRFVEAQLEAFERGAEGWFMWSWKGPGGWSLQNLISNGVVGRTVGDRKFPGVCGAASSYDSPSSY